MYKRRDTTSVLNPLLSTEGTTSSIRNDEVMCKLMIVMVEWIESSKDSLYTYHTGKRNIRSTGNRKLNSVAMWKERMVVRGVSKTKQ